MCVPIVFTKLNSCLVLVQPGSTWQCARGLEIHHGCYRGKVSNKSFLTILIFSCSFSGILLFFELSSTDLIQLKRTTTSSTTRQFLLWKLWPQSKVTGRIFSMFGILHSLQNEVEPVPPWLRAHMCMCTVPSTGSSKHFLQIMI